MFFVFKSTGKTVVLSLSPLLFYFFRFFFIFNITDLLQTPKTILKDDSKKGRAKASSYDAWDNQWCRMGGIIGCRWEEAANIISQLSWSDK
jgi:hypothetical protein